MEDDFAWTGFYMELADKLLPYKENRRELIDKVREVFDIAEMDLPNLNSTDGYRNRIDYIDPFTVMGLFNKQLRTDNRIKIARAMAQVFNVSTEVPYSLDGVPVLNNMMSIFQKFKGYVGEHDNDDLWDLFDAALYYSESRDDFVKNKFINAYNVVKSRYGVNWNLTIALYWIRPYSFIALDSKSRDYLTGNTAPESLREIFSGLGGYVPAGEEYLDMCRRAKSLLEKGDLPYTHFPGVSLRAWQQSQKEDEKSRETTREESKPKRDAKVRESPAEIESQAYTRENFLEDVYITRDDYDTLKGLIERKYNIILQGPPGVGKTFAAKKLAYSLMGEKDESRVEYVQFHQSYSYEDFIQGYRPNDRGFSLENGVFYNFCKKAEADSGRDYFFIIDEINRGNLSKIFGELMLLIEADKRGETAKLVYSPKEDFSVPENLKIIGTMNTADRSLAIIDYALRRRFAFFDFSPAFDSDGFKKYLREKGNEKLERLVEAVKLVNGEIRDDSSLGRGFMIGHSYFIAKGEVDDRELESIVKYEIAPLLSEYWFDEPEKARDRQARLLEALR